MTKDPLASYWHGANKFAHSVQRMTWWFLQQCSPQEPQHVCTSEACFGSWLKHKRQRFLLSLCWACFVMLRTASLAAAVALWTAVTAAPAAPAIPPWAPNLPTGRLSIKLIFNRIRPWRPIRGLFSIWGNTKPLACSMPKSNESELLGSMPLARDQVVCEFTRPVSSW